MQGSLIEKGERVLSLQWVSPEFGAGCRSCRDQYLSCNKELSQQKKPLVAARTSIKGLHQLPASGKTETAFLHTMG